MIRGAFAVGLAVPLLVTGVSAPARAATYNGDSVPGDLQLQGGDSIIGDLHVAGTLTVPSGVTVAVRATDTVTISAAHIAIAGTLDGSGGAGFGGPAAGGPGSSGQGGCGGGAGGSAVSLGGSGGDGPVGAQTAGVASAAPLVAGPGSSGGPGGRCDTQPGAVGGRGGAGIHLSAPDIRISGAVRVDGEDGSNAEDLGGLSGGGGGGGAGGEIWLSGTTVLSGTLSAQGGDGGSAAGRGAGGGGGGSGGRIHVDGGPLIGDGNWSVQANQTYVARWGAAGPNAQAGGSGGKGAVPEVTLPTSTVTTLLSSLNPSTAGQPITFTADVAPGEAIGTVAFTADGSVITGCDAVPVSSGTASCSTSTLATGDHPIAATFTPDTPAYAASAGTLDPVQTVHEALLPQSITFSSKADHLIGEAPFALTGVVGGQSGNPVTFTASGPCTVTAATVTLTGVGTCEVTADQAGGNGYLPAQSVERDFVIGYGERIVSLSASGRRGGLVVVVLRLADAAGRNLSSAEVPVHATALDGGPLSAAFSVDTSTDFRYQPLLRSYTFAGMARSGLTRGSHTLTFIAGQDPGPHTVTFTTY
jgi:hypothetical protein